MNCPRCWQPWACSCTNCYPRNKGKMLWKWTSDGNHEICPRCGLIAHADWWFEEEIMQLPSEHSMAPVRIGKFYAQHIRDRLKLIRRNHGESQP